MSSIPRKYRAGATMITARLPVKLMTAVRKHPTVNWSEVIREAVEATLRKLGETP